MRNYLVKAGWDIQWIDGVMSEMSRGTLSTSVSHVEAVLQYLEQLDIPLHRAENMVSICKAIFGCSLDQMKSVVAWLENNKITGPTLIELLASYPQVLTYIPSSDGSCLEKGKSRASLIFDERNGKPTIGIQFWREGAAFGQSPVTPKTPSK